MICLFLDEKNFEQDQKLKNADSSEVPTLMLTKFPANVMVVSYEGQMMPPHVFPELILLPTWRSWKHLLRPGWTVYAMKCLKCTIIQGSTKAGMDG